MGGYDMVSRQTPISRALAEGQLTEGGARNHGANVGDGERMLSAAAGGLVTWLAIKQGGLLGTGLAILGGGLIYRALSGHCPMYTAMGKNSAGKHSIQASVAAGHGFKLEQAIAINGSAEDLFNIWRDFENLPRFMSHLVRIKARRNRSHWVARGPAGTTVTWDAEIVTEDPGRMIAWRSLEGSQVNTAGSVHFTPLPAGRGTEVRVTLKYDPPCGPLGSWLAWVFRQDPENQIREDLRRFKQMVEAGEIARAELRPLRRF
jgi:uncharacterized membrane protein